MIIITFNAGANFVRGAVHGDRMRHLVVVAHPAAHSFTMSLARAYVSELEQLGHRQVTYDLYRMGFNPVLTAQELVPGAEHAASADIARAQEDIRGSDALTLIYPLWWMSMPAMMKGYIDRVFARGFAYESHGGMVRGLLSGKKIRVDYRLRSAAAAPRQEWQLECGAGTARYSYPPFDRLRAAGACAY
jgi:NAD(P)H-dependent FMN reductase